MEKKVRSISEIPQEERGLSIEAQAALRKMMSQDWIKDNPDLAQTHRPHIHSDGSITIEPIRTDYEPI